jgi:aminopeptidase YwaD
MHRKLFTSVLVISIALSAALAQQTTTTPSIERLRTHIEYLASDKLEGRRTATPGATLAAEYIAREFSRYGLRRSIGYDTAGMSILEADSPNRYLQKFPYVGSVGLGEKNLLFINPGRADDIMQYRVNEDWIPLGFSANGSVHRAEIIFAGYGISAADLKYDDYAVSPARGRVALVFSGTPDGDNPHGSFARAGAIRFKAAAATAAGATALMIIASEAKLSDDRLSGLAYDNAGESGIPIVVVSRRLAAKILGATNGDLAPYEKIADARTLDSTSSTDGGTTTSLPARNNERLRPSNLRLDLSTNIVLRESPSANVVGILDGSDPVLKKEVIVIGAHYDHLGLGGEGSLAPREGEIHHGADDNASGTAALLELARIFSQQGSRPRRTLMFIAFSGEEEGLLGSNYYVNHPILPLANTVAMLNLDMVGRMRENKLIIGGMGTAEQWRSIVAVQNRALATTVSVASGTNSPTTGYPIVVAANGRPIVTSDTSKQFALTLNEDGFGPSDHSSFYAKQIPVLFFWTGTHDDYHKPSDTADKINYADEARIVEFVARIVGDLDSSNTRPTYALAKSDSAGRASGFRVYLGTIPNYADSTDGLLLDGVRDASPAATAGIKAGDKVVKLAGREIRNVYDYTYALGEMKAGQEYEVELMRAGQRIKLVITPAARK